MEASSSSPPPEYPSPGRHANYFAYISTAERLVFGVLLPNGLLAGGYYLTLMRTKGRGDSGFGGMMLFFIMPFVLTISAAFSAFAISIIPRDCQTRLLAFIVGSVVPFLILIFEFIIVDGSLPARYRMLQ